MFSCTVVKGCSNPGTHLVTETSANPEGWSCEEHFPIFQQAFIAESAPAKD